MIKDLVSIVTPSYNSSEFIAETIESVLGQSYKKWEMIIVDDASLDNSSDIIEMYAEKDERIKSIKLTKNGGGVAARNKGIDKASGDYMVFLDHDDVWHNDFLEKSLELMVSNDYGLVFSSYEVIDKNSNKALNDFIAPDRVNYQDMLKTSSIGCLTAVYNVQKLGKIYMQDVWSADYVFWLTVLKKIDYAYSTKEPLAKYRVLTNSMSNNKFNQARHQWEVYRKIEKINLFKSVYYFVQYAYYGLKKHKLCSILL